MYTLTRINSKVLFLTQLFATTKKLNSVYLRTYNRILSNYRDNKNYHGFQRFLYRWNRVRKIPLKSVFLVFRTKVLARTASWSWRVRAQDLGGGGK